MPPPVEPADADTQDKALFDMQWKLWVASDVMRAFRSVNKSAGSVLQSPVKRLISLRVLPLENAGSQASSSSGEAVAMGAPAADGTGGGEAPAAPAPDAPLAEPSIDIKAEAARDYSKRFTGRVSNGIYDVRLSEVSFIADTERLPMVFDALAAQNFMTITNVRIAPADPFAAARTGFLYGVKPVSQVTATIETLWFRDWTARHMPAAMRTALGITSGAPAASGDASPAAQGM